MAETDYVYVEVLTGNPHWEMAKIASSSYFSNKYFHRYCAMTTLFSSFPHDKGRRICSTQDFFFHLLKLINGCQNLLLQQDSHTLSFCGHTSADF